MRKRFTFCTFEARYKHSEGVVHPLQMAYVIDNRKYRKKLRKLHVEDVHLKCHCKWG